MAAVLVRGLARSALRPGQVGARGQGMGDPGIRGTHRAVRVTGVPGRARTMLAVTSTFGQSPRRA